MQANDFNASIVKGVPFFYYYEAIKIGLPFLSSIHFFNGAIRKYKNYGLCHKAHLKELQKLYEL